MLRQKLGKPARPLPRLAETDEIRYGAHPPVYKPNLHFLLEADEKYLINAT